MSGAQKKRDTNFNWIPKGESPFLHSKLADALSVNALEKALPTMRKRRSLLLFQVHFAPFSV